jgi:predicted nucleotide-binding protein (sugar kinase/HSP70/actin superfamily)
MNEKKYKISFPHMGNYYVPVYNLLDNVIDHENSIIIVPKKISKNTIEIGNNVSPDAICVPFKYNMGNFIESLNMGANVIIQAGGGCRYGYYSEVQEQILNDLGYKFMYISILDAKGVDPYKVYKKFKIINPKLKFTKFLYRFLVTIKLLEILDEIETYIRENISYEKVKGEFNQILDELLKEMLVVKNISSSEKIKKKYLDRLKHVKLREEERSDLKIGIVGELYTSMEPSATYFLEEELNKMGIKFKRYTTVTYLLFKKGKAEKKLLKTANKYIDYALGADGTESVAHTLQLIDKGYDGIIHIKPFACTPEVNAMPILQKISEDKNIPIMFLTFDSQTSNTGIKTRLEAFYDMLKMKKESMEHIK